MLRYIFCHLQCQCARHVNLIQIDGYQTVSNPWEMVRQVWGPIEEPGREPPVWCCIDARNVSTVGPWVLPSLFKSSLLHKFQACRVLQLNKDPRTRTESMAQVTERARACSLDSVSRYCDRSLDSSALYIFGCSVLGCNSEF